MSLLSTSAVKSWCESQLKQLRRSTFNSWDICWLSGSNQDAAKKQFNFSFPPAHLPTQHSSSIQPVSKEFDVTPLLSQGWHHWRESRRWFLTWSQHVKEMHQPYNGMAAVRVVLPALLDVVVRCLHSLSSAPECGTGPYPVTSPLSSMLSQMVRAS